MNAAMLSPFVGFAQLADCAASVHIGTDRVHTWLTFWTLTLSGGATALLLATRGSFDRCLGRITAPDESSSRRSPGTPPHQGL